MPAIELRDPTGHAYRITSRDPETIRRWLLEHAELAATSDVALGPWELTVWPLFDAAGGRDWPGGVTVTGVPQKFARLARWLRDLETGEPPA